MFLLEKERKYRNESHDIQVSAESQILADIVLDNSFLIMLKPLSTPCID